MTVRRLRIKQRGRKCDHCTLKADYRGAYFARFACEAHLSLLKAEDERACRPDHSDAEFSLFGTPQ